MSSRKDLAETLRELIRQVSSSDPQSRKLALIEQFLNIQITSVAGLAAAIADYSQEVGQRIAALEKQVADLNTMIAPSTVIRKANAPAITNEHS